MKKQRSFLVGLLIVTGMIVSGCVTDSKKEEDTSMVETESEYSLETESEMVSKIEYLTPVLALQTSEYIRSTSILYHEDNNEYYYIKAGQLKQAQMKDFSASFIEKSESYDINFKWCEVDGQISLFYNLSDMPEGFMIKTIPNNTNVVYLGKSIKVDGDICCRICNLQNNTIEQLYNGTIERMVEDADGIQDVCISTDMKTAIVDYKGKALLYDGREMVDLANLCGRDDADSVSAYYQDDRIVISCVMFPDGDISSRRIECYIYESQTGEIKQTVEEMEALYIGTQPDGFAFDGRFGWYYMNSKLILVDLVKGAKVETAFTLGEVDKYRPLTENMLGLYLANGKVVIVDASTGEALVETEYPIKNNSSISMEKKDEYVYVNVQADEEILVYKVDIEE